MKQEHSTNDLPVGNPDLNRVCVLLAGVPVCFYARFDAPRITLAQPYQSFQVDLPAEVSLEVLLTSPPVLPLDQKLFETRGWQLYASGNQLVFHINLLMEYGEIDVATCVLSEDRTQGWLYLNRPDWPPDFSMAMPPQSLEEKLAVLLLVGRGMLLHASGVIVDGKSFIFTGMSGAGKTTMMNIWKQEPGIIVLSEERVAVRQVGGQYWAYGTSWHMRENHFGFSQAPIERVFVLRHAPQNILRPLSGVEAVSQLLSRSFSPLWDPVGMAYNMQFLSEMVQVVPCAELGFVPDRQVVDFLRNP